MAGLRNLFLFAAFSGFFGREFFGCRFFGKFDAASLSFFLICRYWIWRVKQQALVSMVGASVLRFEQTFCGQNVSVSDEIRYLTD